MRSNVRRGNTSSESTLHYTETTTLAEPKPLPFDEPHQNKAIMHRIETPRLLAGEVNWDYELLVYEDHRIVVPRSGRHALIQAAHAAAHQGMGSMRSLLEKSFYWPNMQHNAHRFVQACRAVQARKITSPGRQRLVLAPNASPEQAPTDIHQDPSNPDSVNIAQPDKLARTEPEGELAPPPTEPVDAGEPLQGEATPHPLTLDADKQVCKPMEINKVDLPSRYERGGWACSGRCRTCAGRREAPQSVPASATVLQLQNTRTYSEGLPDANRHGQHRCDARASQDQ